MSKIIKLIQFYKIIGRRMRDGSISAYSACVTLFMVMSAFPFIMFMLTILQYTSMTESTLISYISKLVPTNIGSILISWITEIYHKASGTIISVTAITTLWSASKGFLALLNGLNAVYHIKETRNYIRLRITCTIYTLIFAVMLIVTLIVLVFGNRLYAYLYNKFQWLNTILRYMISFRILASFVLLLIFFMIILLFVPNRKSRLSAEFPGAFIATCGWIGFSYVYSYYYDNFSGFSSIYGSLTSIVLLMLWIYFCMNILFFGAELNYYLQNDLS